ncbi:YadA-like family protein [Halomonas sp. BLK-85]
MGTNAQADPNSGNSVDNSIVIGTDAESIAEEGIAIGQSAWATRDRAVALGSDAHATGLNALAFGTDSQARATDSQASGTNADARSTDSQASGTNALARGTGAIATGTNSVTRANNAIATGTQSQANGEDSIATGTESQANGEDSIATGTESQADEVDSIAIGTQSQAIVEGGVALGAGSLADTAAGETGYKPFGATAVDIVAIDATEATQSAVDVGSRQITSLAAGTQDDDAVNVSQLIASQSKVEAGTNTAVTTSDNPDGGTIYTVDADGTTVSNGSDAVTVTSDGPDADNVTDYAVDLSQDSKDSLENANKGWDVQVNAETADNVAPGEAVQFVDGQNIAITRDSDQVIKVATADDVEFNQVTIGDATDPANSTVLTNVDGALDVSGDQITNVADGDISDTSTDAINGSQLFATNENVDTNTTNITNNTTAINEGLNFGDGATSNNYALGDTINVNGDANVTSTTSADGVQLGLADVINVGSDNPVSIDGDTGTIGGLTNDTFDPDNFTSGQAATEDQLKDISDVANAGWDVQVNAETADNVASGEAVQFVDGQNIAITRDSDQVIKVATADDVEFNQVTIGDATDSTTSTVLTNVDGALDVSGDQITNVADGEISDTSTDAINGSQLFATNENVDTNTTNITNNTTAINEGLNFGDGATSNNYALGDTINVNGDANVTSTTTTDGVQLGLADVINVGSDNPVSIDGDTGTIGGLTNDTFDPDNFTSGQAATEDQLKDISDVANAGWDVQVNAETEDNVAPGETVQFVDGQNIAITRDSDQVIKVATADDVEFNQVTIGDASDSTTSTVLTNVDGALDVSGDQITNVADGEISDTSTDAINGSQLFATNENVDTNTTNITNNTTAINEGLNFGDGATSNNYALGDTINVNGDANVTSTTSADGVQLGLADVINVGSTNPVSIDGDTGTIGGLTNDTFDPDNFTSGQAATEDQLKDISDVANAGWDVQVNTETADNVASGEAVQFVDGQNIAITRDSDQVIKVATADDVEFNQVTIGDATDPANSTVLTNVDGALDVGGDQITNVADGEISDTSTDAINGSQLFATNENVDTNTTNITNNTTAINEGLNFGDGATSNNYALGDTINVNGDANVTSTTSADGVQLGLADVINVGSTNPVSIDGDTGTIGGLTNDTFDPDNFTSGQAATEDQLKDISDVANAGWDVQVNTETADNVASGEAVQFVDGQNIAITRDSDQVIKVATADDVEFNQVTIGDATDPANSTVLTNVDGALDVGGDQITNVADGEISDTSTDAINGSQLFATNENVDTNTTNITNNTTAINEGLNFGDGATSNNYALGDTINVNGDANVTSTTSADGVQLGLADVINVGSDNPVSIDGDTGTIGGLTNDTFDPDNFTSGQAATEDQLKDISDVANAGWDVQVNAETEDNVAPGETVQFVDGQNIAITRDSDQVIKVATADDVEFNQVTIGDASDSTTSTVLTNVDGALDVSGDQITGVGSGLDDQVLADITGDDLNNAVNVGDLQDVNNDLIDTGFNIAADNGSDDNVKLGETVNYTSEDGNVVTTVTDNQIDFGLASSIDVGSTNTVTIDGDAGTIGGLTNDTFDPDNFISGQAASEDQLKQVSDVATAGWDVQVNAETADNVAPGEAVQFVDGQNIAITRDSDQVIKVATADDVEFNQVTIGDASDSTTSTVLTNVDGALDVSGDQITGVGSGLDDQVLADITGDDLNNAVNVGDLQDVNNDLIDTGFNIAADNGTDDNVKLGETVNYTSEDGNVVTTVTDNQIDFGLASSIDVGSTNTVTIDGDAGTIGGLTNDTFDPDNFISGQAASEDQLKQVSDVATAGWDVQVNAETADNVAPGEAVQFVDGQNIAITRDSDQVIKVATADDVEFNQVTIGDATDSTTSTVLTNVDGALDVSGDQITGVGSGLDDQVLADITGDDLNNAVNVGDLQDVNNDLIDTGFNIAADNGTDDNVKLGETVDFTSADGNIITTVDDNEIDFGLGNDLTIGDDEAPGSITVNGQDGEDGIALNGEDGTIGLTGPAGTDGAPAATIGVEDGAPGVDGDPGTDGITRIVYEGTDQNGDPITETVATLNDGLNFAGNTGETIAKELNDTLNIEGELADGDAASGANLRVDSAEGQLNLVMARNLTELDSATFGEPGTNDQFTINKDGVEFVDAAGEQRVGTPSIAEDGIDGGNNQITSVESGLTGTTLADAEGDDLTNAVNVGDLQDVNNDLIDTGFNIAADNGTDDNVKLGETVDFTSADGNIITTVDDNEIDFGLGNDLTIGDDEAPGSITVNGQDGEDGIALNGEDGTIGLTGPAGTDGAPAATIGVEDGAPGVDGDPGTDGITRIVYEGTDQNGDPITETVATLNDGLNFAGNTGETIAKELNDTLNIEGELADGDAASGANLRVDSAEGQLNLVMARNLTELDSATFGEPGTNDQFTINKDGVEFVDAAGEQRVGTPSIAEDGIDGGNNQITSVESGLTGTTLADAEGDDLTNAVNVGDLQDVNNDLIDTGFNIAADNGTDDNVKLGETVDFTSADGNIITTVDDNEIDFGLGNDLTIGDDEAPGSITVNGQDGEDGIALNGEDGTIGLTGPAGTDGAPAATIGVEDGAPGVDGDPGTDGITRIVYEGTDQNGDPITETVATLNDGLNFAGNTGETIAKELNDTLNIEGELADGDAASGANLRVDSAEGQLNLVMARNLTELDSATFGEPGADDQFTINKDGVQFVDDAGDQRVDTPSIAEDGIDGGNNQITGVGSGLDDQVLADITGDDLNNAVNVGDLQDVNNDLIDTGFKITADNTNLTTADDNVKLGETVDFTSADGNIITTVDNNEIDFGLGNDLTIGDDEAPGSITVNGQDGEDGIVLNGEDGSIGLTGKAGAGADITVADGEPGVDGIDGETTTRIVYEGPEGEEEVATLNDGLKFGANDGDVHNAELNTQVDITGAADNDDWSAFDEGQNIMTQVDDNNITVALAKNLTGLDSATFVNSNGNDRFTINENGVEFVDVDGNRDETAPSIAADGIDGGDNQITGVESGLNGTPLATAEGDDLTNAVNVGDLQEVSTAENGGGFGLADTNGDKVTQDLGETITVTDPDGNITTTADDEAGELQLGLGNDLTIGEDGDAGSITVTGEDGEDGIVLNGEDGSIGITGKDGAGADITVADGEPGVDGIDGETTTRIVYEGPEGEEEVATLNDGLKFVGDDGEVVERKLNETLGLTGGADTDALTDDNIGITQDDEGGLKVQLAENVDLGSDGSVKAGDSSLDTDGLVVNDSTENPTATTEVEAGRITLSANPTTGPANEIAIDANTGTIGGLTNTTFDPNATYTGGQAATQEQLGQVYTVANAGWNLSGSGENSVNIGPDGTVDFRGDNNITVTQTGEDQDGRIEVALNDSITLGEGEEAVTLDGDNGRVSVGDTLMNGDGVSVGDDVQLGNEGLVIADGPSVTSSGIDAGNSVITNVAPGEEDTDAVNVSQLKDGVAAASTEVKAGDNINVSEADGDNGQTIYTVETQRDVDFDSIEVGSVDIDQGNVDENGNTVITGMGRGDISENSTDAVNGSQLWDVQQGLGDINESLTGGRDFAADEGKTINRKLDETLTVSGDQNITTKTSERGVQVTLERDLDVDSVTTGGTTINDNGLTIEDGPSVTRDGVDAGGEVITNVAPGVEASDAVNVGQMNELGQRFQNEINNVNGRIDDVEKNANAGSASAIAASSVPQAWRSGESMVSVGAGTYGGESAVAVGVSRLSDNGRWIIQGKVTGDSQGEFGAGVGAGWHW